MRVPGGPPGRLRSFLVLPEPSGVRDKCPSVPAPGKWISSRLGDQRIPARLLLGITRVSHTRAGQGQQRFQKAHSARPNARHPANRRQKTWFLMPESGKGEGIYLYKKTARLAIRKNFATEGSKDGFAGFPSSRGARQTRTRAALTRVLQSLRRTGQKIQ